MPCKYGADVGLGDDDLVAQDAGRVLRDVPARVTDEAGHQDRGQRVEQGIAEPHAEQRAEHRDGCQHVAARVLCVGPQQFAVQPVALPALVGHHGDVDDERHRHQRDPLREHARRPAVEQAVERRRQHLDEDDDQEHEDPDRGHGLVFAVAAWVVLVRGRRATEMPTSATTFDAESVSE